MSIEIQDSIRRLSEGIVLVDTNDVEALARLHELFDRVANETAAAGQADLAIAAKVGVHRLEQLILREVQDTDATLAAASKIIAGLQALICHGRPFDEITFPDDVKAKIDESHATPAAAPATAPVAASTPAPVSTPNAPAPAQQAAPAPAAAVKNPSPVLAAVIDAPFTLNADPDLMGEFISESKEHLDSVDVHLLTIESNHSDPEAVNAVFRAFHTIKGVAGFLELKPIQALAHESETLLDKCRKGAMALAGAVLDVVFEAADAMKALIAAVEQAMNTDKLMHTPATQAQLIARIVAIAEGKAVAAAGPTVAAAPLAAAAPSAATATAATTPAPKVNTPPASAASVAPTAAAPTAAPVAADAGDHADQPKSKTSSVVKETVRVDSERLDKLVDTIGEMVIAEAMVSQSTEWSGIGSTPLARMLNHLDKITRELQELAMSLRMVPVKSTFQRMAKLARDVSKKLNKPVDFVTDGDDTELDKNVVDAIGDPLVHMVRNAVDHGLEDSVETRRAAGKPDAGRVELRAFHKGGSIYIEIEDDGRGIDRDVVLAKAIERGIVEPGKTLTDSEAFALIFEPGFSTAKTITDVSGRGVGLDVVKRNIAALRGKVEIRSEKGKGSVFSIRLPLTLAIIEGMVIRLASQRYIIPTLSIVRMIRPEERQRNTVFGRGEMLKLGDQIIPLYRLDRLFNVDGATQDPQQAAVVVIEHDGRQIGVLVDELLGQQQIVIKSLGAMLRKYPGFSGGAIMPDGRVGLILDIGALVNLATAEPSLAAAA